jgi:hypothetical protein
MNEKRMENEEKKKEKVTKVRWKRREKWWRVDRIFVPGRISPCTNVHICTGWGGIPCTNVTSHLYLMVCTGWIPGTNEGYHPVQMPVFQ